MNSQKNEVRRVMNRNMSGNKFVSKIFIPLLIIKLLLAASLGLFAPVVNAHDDHPTHCDSYGPIPSDHIAHIHREFGCGGSGGNSYRLRSSFYDGMPMCNVTPVPAGYRIIGTFPADTDLSFGGLGTHCFKNNGLIIEKIPPSPINLTFSSAVVEVEVGDTAFLNWSTTGGSSISCTGSGAWTGQKSKSGSETVGPLSIDSTFILTCSDPVVATVSKSVFIKVLPLGSIPNVKISYLHNDALGSPVAATNEKGDLLWKEAYFPYGDQIRKDDGSIHDNWFTAKPYDDDIRLSYFGARWYDPTVGRFMAMDPVGFNEENVHSFNRYGYGNGNPYLYIDPDGREPLDYVKGAGNELASMAIMLNPVMYATSFFVDTPKFQYVDQGDGEVGEWGVIGVSSVVGGAGVARGTLKSTGKVISQSSDELITVSRWGREGLSKGDWVMKGEKNFWSYLKSGKWQPGFGNKFTKFNTGESFKVPQNAIRKPRKGDVGTKYESNLTLKIKGWLKQRIYDPE